MNRAPRRLSRRQFAHGVLACSLPLGLGCTHFSPFEVDLPGDERDFTSKQLAALASRPPPPSNWRFAVVSDTHLGYDELETVIARINTSSDIQFVLVPGDITDLGLREEYRVSLSLLSELRVPFFTAIGNHDAISNGQALYGAMFGPFDYAFVFGGIKFVLYNNNSLEFEQEVPNLAWLEGQISDPNGADGVVVVAHMPPTAEENDLLARHDVVAFIGGHVHRTDLWHQPLTTFLAPHGAKGHWVVVDVAGTELTFSACEEGNCEVVRV